MRLTAEMLEQAEACQYQLDLFRERFPEGVVPTEALCLQNQDFDYEWAAQLLSPEKQKRFWDIVGQARIEYAGVIATARATYEAAIPAEATYKATNAAAGAMYAAAVAPALAAYQAAKAAAFGRLWEEP